MGWGRVAATPSADVATDAATAAGFTAGALEDAAGTAELAELDAEPGAAGEPGGPSAADDADEAAAAGDLGDDPVPWAEAIDAANPKATKASPNAAVHLLLTLEAYHVSNAGKRRRLPCRPIHTTYPGVHPPKAVLCFRVEPRVIAMPHPSSPISHPLLRGWMLACTVALALSFPIPARAQALPHQPSTPDDLPGVVAIDLDDDLSQSQLEDFGHDFGVSLEPSSILTAHTRIHRVSVPLQRVAALLAKLKKDHRVEHVEPVAKVHARWTPDDPMLEKQWHLHRVDAPRAWHYATGRGVTVAVVDTGVACEDHDPFSKGSDLADTWCRSGFNFVNNTPHANDDNGHGTHVAGTIAQSTNNQLGTAGVAFQARLLPVKVLSAQGWGTTVAVADGIRYAANAGAHVINLSLGGARASRIMLDAIRHARDKGVIVVAAAGNNGSKVEYPGAFEEVLAVSATQPDDSLARFSSRGPQVDLAAPGVHVLQQTICNGGRDRCERFSGLSGTSMACPHVAGAAALLMSVGVTDPERVESMLEQSATLPKGEKRGGPKFGAGILNAGQAVASTVWLQAITRLLLVALLTGLVVHRIRRKRGIARPWRPGLLLGALAFGPGLLCLAPLVATRVPLAVDLLARPIPEWDLLIGVSVHRWLPLAHFFVPLAMSALFYSFKRARPWIAGTAIGTAAYLASVPLLGLATSDAWSRGLLSVWALLNMAGCVWLAALNLDEREPAS